jgi:hypothetical protein
MPQISKGATVDSAKSTPTPHNARRFRRNRINLPIARRALRHAE